MGDNIMIVTGEASGDLHGANLVKALLRKNPRLQFCGMGGAELAALGVEILYDAGKVSVVGVFEVFSHLKDLWLAQRILRRRLAEDPPDLLILIDLPDAEARADIFKIHLEGKGIPVDHRSIAAGVR